MKGTVAAVLTALTLTAQSAPPQTFDAVSVKRNRSGDQNSSTRARPGGGAQITNNTLRQILRNVYQQEEFLIVGGPPWVDSERFDVLATGNGQEVAFDVVIARMKAALAERFGLVVRNSEREMPIYELMRVRTDRLGPQLRQSTIDCRPAPAGTPRPAPIVPPGAPAGESPVCGIRRRQGMLLAGGGPLDEVSRALSGLLGRPTVDRTGLSGTFDLALSWDADLAGGQGVSVFAAVQEQLGLKLEAGRGPVKVLVIDRAEMPAED